MLVIQISLGKYGIQESDYWRLVNRTLENKIHTDVSVTTMVLEKVEGRILVITIAILLDVIVGGKEKIDWAQPTRRKQDDCGTHSNYLPDIALSINRPVSPRQFSDFVNHYGSFAPF